MIRYFPLQTNGEIRPDTIGLLTMSWKTQGFSSVFRMLSDTNVEVEFLFSGRTLIRVLDESALYTEDHWSESQGRDDTAVLYRVENAPFFKVQSQYFMAMLVTPQHFQVVTDGACIDVIAARAPQLSTRSSVLD